MAGKNCCAIASDLRFGVQLHTISMDFPKIYEMGPNLFVGFSGLATDAQTIVSRLKFRLNLYSIRENKEMSPELFVNVLANLLYEKRFGSYFIEPVIAGLNTLTKKPIIANMDNIGCSMITHDFVCGGTASEQLYGICETFWEPEMDPDTLFEAISQSLLNAQDRDASSGWGALVYLIEPEKVTIRKLKGRMD
ncbi:unnamed protein product [Gordionus sp. m RMFG-2023]